MRPLCFAAVCLQSGLNAAKKINGKTQLFQSFNTRSRLADSRAKIADSRLGATIFQKKKSTGRPSDGMQIILFS
jgi:hypothetical protein